MDIILLERIDKLGQMGDVVTVKAGYARNFLLPKKKALRATDANKTAAEKTAAAGNTTTAAASSASVASKTATVGNMTTAASTTASSSRSPSSAPAAASPGSVTRLRPTRSSRPSP